MEWRRRAEQGGAVVGAGAVRARRWRGARRDGVAEQERRACGSGGAAREWRRRSGVRARGAGRQFREEEEKQRLRLTRGPAERVKRKQNERARQP